MTESSQCSNRINHWQPCASVNHVSNLQFTSRVLAVTHTTRVPPPPFSLSLREIRSCLAEHGLTLGSQEAEETGVKNVVVSGWESVVGWCAQRAWCGGDAAEQPETRAESSSSHPAVKSSTSQNILVSVNPAVSTYPGIVQRWLFKE
jgi:hypothetical protein